MRFNLKEKPKIGTTRERKKFAFIPVRITDKIVVLWEWYFVEEQFGEYFVWDGGMGGFYKKKWVVKEKWI